MADHSQYTVSIQYDRRLYRQDIAGSIVHARMLAKQGIISGEDADLITEGLTQVGQEIEADGFPWDPSLEDLHMNIESRLHQLIGPAAGSLHTARSRNDQIAPGHAALYQRGHHQHLCQIAWGPTGPGGPVGTVQRRDHARLHPLAAGTTGPVRPPHAGLFPDVPTGCRPLLDCYRRTDVLPLGSGALAGVAYPSDREFLARELGFKEISANSMDAVSDRDFVLEYLAAAAICMMHLSRLAEEIVLWSSREFAFVTLSEDFTTGSSIMPQKRNPDFAELARGKTGRVYGHLLGLLTVLKGLPLTYNRDLQEDKEGFFDTVDTLLATLEVFEGMLSGLTLNVDRVTALAGESQALATDLADYLVGKGVPFREAHGIVRELCRYCESEKKELKGLGLEEYQGFSPLFEQDVYQITTESATAARDNPGGTAPQRVADALAQARKILEAEADNV